jgi:oxygen-independent coproporphyrinogen-3 oxidase
VIRYCTEIESGRLPIAAKEVLSAEQLVIEAIYLGLRTTAGIDIAAFNRKFDLDFGQIFKETIMDLQNKGFIKADSSTCALSRRGMVFLDSTVAMFTNQEITI